MFPFSGEVITLVTLLVPLHMYMASSVLTGLVKSSTDVTLLPLVTSVMLVRAEEESRVDGPLSDNLSHSTTGVGIPNAVHVNEVVLVSLTTVTLGPTDTRGGSDNGRNSKKHVVITLVTYNERAVMQ